MTTEYLAELVERVKGHTPLPWTVEHDADGDLTICGTRLGHKFQASDIVAITWTDTPEDAANAELIAAAPSLLTLALEQAEEIKRLKAELEARQ